MQSEQVNELFTALSKAQARIKPAIKDANNPFFKSKYADLPAIWHVCQEPLTSNGLTIIQGFETVEGRDYLVTTLGHVSGQWIKSKCPILCNDNKPQSYGSACSYARRYALAAICGVVTDDDDDGEAAMGRDKNQPKPLDKWQKDKIKELSKNIPENTQGKVKEWVKSKGYDGALNVPQSLFQELCKLLTDLAKEEALPY